MREANGHRVVVLGAGYAGLVAAQRLARRICPRGASVTLVNAEPRFVERIRLHQVAAGQTVADLPLAALLAGSGARLLVGRVTGIDLDARTVRVGEEKIGYDTLVYGLGSVTDVNTVPGAAEHAAVLSWPQEALRLAARLSDLARRGGAAVVCGGGPTGVELATELAESYPGLSVRMVTRWGSPVRDSQCTNAAPQIPSISTWAWPSLPERVNAAFASIHRTVSATARRCAARIRWAVSGSDTAHTTLADLGGANTNSYPDTAVLVLARSWASHFRSSASSLGARPCCSTNTARCTPRRIPARTVSSIGSFGARPLRRLWATWARPTRRRRSPTTPYSGNRRPSWVWRDWWRKLGGRWRAFDNQPGLGIEASGSVAPGHGACAKPVGGLRRPLLVFRRPCERPRRWYP
ncbi:Pyridine nucleotide-disulfide oxidoreductase [Streptoalloteichus tenebrarius]|uniref:Pyridine nucleotide-disulfide oxidoreductase n=1 Tax=Streptoalloteichus tenebrarius (strain ATCC 17920 / DSM 40477 / JCM 4838 / CBS 697.72 / NBRC 16177 / NCIMB 11028 / NRRL B-12390 / A12253. 1 / ISP 5477) TaxID=1933 RepID=A0ABT1HPM8_STRSD|nr:FAD-dependent oxidoreductase [Streptoalloteichus tenebrarius]MCP2257459.1 Pyridine nucleotide-disulfide oxidoreductase [Streptoalloteichus tenebrarius]BFE98408.1 hypothetical protein GCM10020241_00840 [Streptoalloteichus tenebrarius]